MTGSTLFARIPTPLRSYGAALAAVAALQLGALGYMVFDRIRLIKTGREIVLPIVPVDPRDLFKGDYVRLGFPITNVPQEITLPDAKSYVRGAAYVTIEQQPDASWTMVRVTPTLPTSLPANQVALRAKQPNFGRTMRYGIERYYVPEGKGRPLEKLAREKKLAAVVAVDSNGNAAIKGLSTDGVRVYDEPLF